MSRATDTLLSGLLSSVLMSGTMPRADHLLAVFKSMSRLTPESRTAMLASLDPAALAKLSEWASEFVAQLNSVAELSEKPGEQAHTPKYTTDFFEAMGRVKFVGDRLQWRDLAIAQNKMVKALKAQNLIEGIQIGISLAGALP